MLLGTESKPSQQISTGGCSLEQFGPNNGYFILYEEHKPGLPEEFDGPDGWRYLRTGPVNGGTSRHPAEDWVSDRSLGPGRSVQLAAIFVYDPKAGEVKMERVEKINDYFRKREEYQAQGWMLVVSALDRVVRYRAFPVQKVENTSPLV